MDQSESQLVVRTIEVWQPRAARSLSDADARQISENIAGFFSLLLEWEAREKERTARETDDSCYAMPA